MYTMNIKGERIMKKKLRVILLGVYIASISIFALSSCSIFGDADNDGDDIVDKKPGEIKYELLLDDTYKVTGFSGDPIGELTIPSTHNGKSVTVIGEHSFSGWSGWVNITISDSVTTIENYAFSRCSGLTNVTIGSGVKTIGYGAFENCTGLANIVLPNGLERIGSEAFYGCSKLTNITLPDSLTSIGDNVFGGCNLICAEYGNALYAGNANNPYLVLIAAKNKDITSCNINEKTKFINARAFYNSFVTDVTISSGVTSIGACAFYNCGALTNVTIPDSVIEIGYSVFERCESLTNINIPSGVKSIGGSAFSFCVGLTSVIIPQSVTSIGRSAFNYCNLTIYCECEEQPNGWDFDWVGGNGSAKVVWGYNSGVDGADDEPVK